MNFPNLVQFLFDKRGSFHDDAAENAAAAGDETDNDAGAAAAVEFHRVMEPKSPVEMRQEAIQARLNDMMNTIKGKVS